MPLDYGIIAATYATMGGENVQAWPPRRWRNCAQYDEVNNVTKPAAQFEIWPMPPGQPFSIRIEGNAPLNPLVEDTDVCVIDATLIVLIAAAEILAVQKSEGASMKLQKANPYRRMLIARLGAQQRNMKSLSKDGGHMGPIHGGTPADALPRLHPALRQRPAGLISDGQRCGTTSASGGGGASLYYEIDNFQTGMDLRKSPMTAPAGSLRALKNAHITPGGEIEKRSQFALWCQAPAGSIGLVGLNEQVYTHLPDGGGGSVTAPTLGAIGVFHIAAPSGVTLIKQLDYDVFNGNVFVVLQDGLGNTYCYYNGVHVPQADNLAISFRTYKNKMYGVNGRTLSFCAIGDPTI